MAITNVRRVSLGGGCTRYIGDFTELVGDAQQTLPVEAGRVINVVVTPNQTTEPVDFRTLASWSTSGTVTTITIYQAAAVTAGTIMVDMDHGG